eukprot:GGOE01004997.1.p1 GENE.GGOE01004997.1~~GGOE01004997.1.p1  ORF type:complete len:285 (-),score=76.87 GGOE01004997.1:295-1065(-)
MPTSLLWDQLKAVDVAAINALGDRQRVLEYLQRILAGPTVDTVVDVNDASPASKAPIVLELLYHTLLFCRARRMDAEKTSTLFSIVHRTHCHSMRERAGDRASFDFFQLLLLQHSVHRPPFSETIFAPEDVQAITKYMLDTYYRQYKLYLYAFTPHEVLSISTYQGVDRPERVPPPKPLAAALPDQMWREQEARRQAADAKAQQRQALQAAASASMSAPRRPPQTIEDFVEEMTHEQLGSLEARLAAIEAHLAEQG